MTMVPIWHSAQQWQLAIGPMLKPQSCRQELGHTPGPHARLGQQAQVTGTGPHCGLTMHSRVPWAHGRGVAPPALRHVLVAHVVALHPVPLHPVFLHDLGFPSHGGAFAPAQ